MRANSACCAAGQAPLFLLTLFIGAWVDGLLATTAGLMLSPALMASSPLIRLGQTLPMTD